MRRRRLTADGVQPIGGIHHPVDWFSIEGAGAPATGEPCFLELPSRNADLLHLCIDAFAQAFPDRLHIWRSDHSGAHPAQRLRWPENVRWVWRPPSGPERNPMERLWRDVKDHRAWPRVTDVEPQQAHVSPMLQADEPRTLPSLPSYRSLVEAINALAP